MTPLSCGPPLSPAVFADVRRRMVLDYCKWDPQVGDVAALCRFPLVLDADAWRKLVAWSERLADETLEAEAELANRPELIGELGLPRSIRRVLRRGVAPESLCSAPRIMRFDFHWTTDGWRISEVNSDVPGGFIESSPFTQLVAAKLDELTPTGDPAGAYAELLASIASGPIGLVHATAYSDDRQVMTYLSRLIASHGAEPLLISPADVVWEEEAAHIITPRGQVRAGALVRFFPGEWLPNLGRRSGWPRFFSCQTPHSNPATALVTQSKRFPLVWDRLAARLSTWRELLPETRDPRRAAWRRDERWVLKPSLGRIGDSIGLRGVAPPKEWKEIARSAAWRPSDWAAQRRFEMVAIPSPDGAVFPVIGVYCLDRRVIGVYGRIARQPLINQFAQDVAVATPSVDVLAQEATGLHGGVSRLTLHTNPGPRR